MRRHHSLLLAAGLAASGLLLARGASAQGDLNRPPPNVMLLVDSSGSMEYRSSRTGCVPAGEPCFPSCYPTVSDPAMHQKSRWIELVEVLTGNIQNYSCFEHRRVDPDFRNEFKLGTFESKDVGYSNPYHRPLSSNCVPGAGTLPPAATPYEFPTDFVAFRPFSPSTNQIDYSGTACATPFQQTSDGLLDSFNGQIRFGLMTFDTAPHEGTGVDAGGQADYQDGVAGLWSYYLSGVTCPPGSATSFCSGKPENCNSEFPQEVGARNNSAPPWEGRMVAFGSPNASTAELNQRNEWIQQVLLSTRPFGATPIAGLIHDARDFFFNDTSLDPLTGQSFGPNNAGEPVCRPNSIVLLSDGEPNLDLRPHCEGTTGVCPYERPEAIAANLVGNTGSPPFPVRTYVIGMGVSEVDPDGDGNFTPCEDLPNTTFCTDPTYDNDRDLQACCILNDIALNGTPAAQQGDPDTLDHALFADNVTDLRAALSEVLSRTLGNVTARTHPVFTVLPPSASSRGLQFTSGLDIRNQGLWKGVLSRRRLVCDTQTNEIVEAPFDPSQGDDFIANVASDPTARKLYTVLAEPDGTGARFSERSIRPLVTTDTDGVGVYSGSLTSSAGLDPSGFVTAVDPPAIQVDDTTCDNATEDLTAVQCRDRLLKWFVALDNGTQFQRCPQPGDPDCNVISDIFRSTPQIRTKPNEFLRDEAYTRFEADNVTRDTMLYTSSNDGFLHGFFVAPGDSGPELTTQTNNEVWAFVPPAVLPSVASMYPGTRMPVLDSRAVIKDVIATPQQSTVYPFKLERTQSGAQAGQGTFRTILVQSFGPLRGGYYAVDITKPEIDTADPDTGPKFLWQLTTDANGNALFGASSGTPLITTVFLDTATSQPTEVAVAVLPGGNGGLTTGNSCAAGPLMTVLNPGLTPRTLVNCYDAAANGARSLTIVRLDTGEIIRTFRPTGVTLPLNLASTALTMLDLPSPIMGEPAAFPARTGTAADRLFVGDRDGRLWQVDVSDTNPANWTMAVFFDAYAGSTFDQSHPIVTAPVLSVDPAGNITVNVSTGDQDVLASSTIDNYVYSITEKLDANNDFVAEANWRHVFTGGERVTGPMALFSEGLFFSSFTPDPGAVCDSGTSVIWGVHFINEKTAATLDDGGAPMLPDPGNPGSFVQNTVQAGDPPIDGVVFGVGVRQRPTCEFGATTTASDEFLGFGQITQMTSTTSGEFELVIQIGGQQTATPGLIDTQTIGIARPSTPVTVESWVPILE